MSRVTDSWYLAIDGDDIGNFIELCMVKENAKGLRSFSSTVESILSQISGAINDNPLIEVIMQGGDSILLSLPESEIASVMEEVRSATQGSSITFSGGYGRTMREAYLALRVAKATGKNKFACLDSADCA
jgi:hypothetical protein